MVYKAKVRADIEQNYGEWVSFRDEKVVEVKKHEGGFEVKSGKGPVVWARKVVIATGIKDNLPDIKGE